MCSLDVSQQSARQDLNRFTRLFTATALIGACVAAFYYGLPWFMLPLWWAVYGTALYGLFSVAAACSDDSLTSSKLINRVVGTIALLPVLISFESLKHRRRLVAQAIADSKTTAIHAVDAAVERVGSLWYGWYLSSFVDWIGSAIVFTRDQWYYFVINHVILFAFAAVFFPVMVYLVGYWGLLKFWVGPFLVYHLWMSSSIRVRLAMSVEIRFLQERAEQYKSLIARLEQVPESAVHEISQWLASVRSAAADKNLRIDSWRLRFFDYFFGSDVFGPTPAVSSVFEPVTPASSPVSVADADLNETHANDVAVTSPLDAPSEPIKAPADDKQASLISRINWVTATWLTVTPLLSIYGLATCDWHLKTFVLGFVLYQLGGIGITAGYHRLFSHRSYDAATIPKMILTVMGTSSFEGSVFEWCSDHRAHHRYTDTDRDPYNVNRGFWYAHMGWLLFKNKTRHTFSDISDLQKISWLQFQHRYFALLAMLTGLVLPTLIAGFGWGDWMGGFLIAGVGRTVFLQQCTFFINSLAHFWGDATYSDQRSPRDSYFVSLLTFGEGYHCFHHEFPYDYRNGIRALHYDPGKWVIASMEMLGLAWNLKRFPDEVIEKGKLQMQQKRLNEAKSKIEWGPAIDSLPFITMQDMSNRVAEGAMLLVVDSIVHDVRDFADQHPGGAPLLKSYICKDASLAFNGMSYNHSLAARNILKTLRMARIEDASSEKKTQ
ncbi:delta 9 fatty acid desaturase, variant [Capsaspora owczarzaki ATCC 30864]|uniref:Delta 9 fatty acid desaturase, variant n=1 Tax=Capsaspora owczarzaki (strain ATCC 30864) TaxID=595528 RepID=A0A0D2WKM9_CAPO3|nr:delta 9 fatty acid desaturase, variant [Capsaspora owczarzaki ATCC 30864]